MAPKRSEIFATGEAASNAKKKLTKEEKAARAVLRAQQATASANVDFVTSVMKKHPVVVTEIVQHLGQLGYTRQTVSTSSDVALQSSSTTSIDSSVVGIEGAKTRGDIPQCYRTLGAVPPIYLARLVAFIEPVAFSEQQCKNLSSTKRRCQQREPFLQLIEFCCEVDKEMPLLQVDGTDFHCIEIFGQHLRQKAEHFGRRGRDLSLPVNWQEQGLFGAQVLRGNKLKVWERQHQGPGIAKRMADLCCATLKITDVRKVYISENWSVSRARLREDGGWLARSVEAVLPQRKATQLAIKDRSPKRRRFTTKQHDTTVPSLCAGGGEFELQRSWQPASAEQSASKSSGQVVEVETEANIKPKLPAVLDQSNVANARPEAQEVTEGDMWSDDGDDESQPKVVD